MTYQGRSTYKTRLGGFISLVSYVLIVLNLIDIISKFRTQSSQVESVQTDYIDLFDDPGHNLNDENLRFVLGTTLPIQPAIGRWVVEQSYMNPEPGKVSEGLFTELETTDCSHLYEDLKGYWDKRITSEVT